MGVSTGGAELAERLSERRPELEETILARVYSVEDPERIDDPEYTAGLREAVRAALDYGLGAIATDSLEPQVPHELPAQARQAASSGVSLDTVLRRYFAGYTLLGDFLAQEAGEEGAAEQLKRFARRQAVLFDRLVAAVATAHAEEAGRAPRTSERARAERVRDLLAGELIDTSSLGYELGAWHLGIAAGGAGAGEALREAAGQINARLLAVSPARGTLWAWLGTERRTEAAEALSRLGPAAGSAEAALSIGEPAQGIAGWRLTHRQATAALPLALREAPSAVRYADVALLASALRDEVLVGSLRGLYLLPLERDREDGESLLQTLEAYFAVSHNASSAAALLGVTRQTVNRRLRTIEELLGRPLESCLAEMQIALRLREADRR